MRWRADPPNVRPLEVGPLESAALSPARRSREPGNLPSMAALIPSTLRPVATFHAFMQPALPFLKISSAVNPVSLHPHGTCIHIRQSNPFQRGRCPGVRGFDSFAFFLGGLRIFLPAHSCTTSALITPPSSLHIRCPPSVCFRLHNACTEKTRSLRWARRIETRAWPGPTHNTEMNVDVNDL